MIAILLSAAAAVCTLPDPAPMPDAAAAGVYLEVGDAELAAGSLKTALVAYREAARLDPSSERARSAYLSACAVRERDTLLADGRRRMDEGDCGGALEVFRQLPDDPAAALYQAICLYEQGDDDEARPLLVKALAAPAYEDRARYFLGLIELRDRSGNDAAGLFDRVAGAGGPLAERAEVLRSAALRSGRAVVAAFVESGYDSNVSYTPDSMPASGDFGGAGGLSFSLRPLGLSGPYLRGNAYYRQQAKATDRSLGLFSGQGGYRLGRGETYAFGDYAYEATLLGGSPLLFAHRLRAGGRWQVRRFAVSALYALRFETFQTLGSTAYSGTAHSFMPEISYWLPLGSSISLGYFVSRDLTSFAYTSTWEHGPRAAVRWVLRPTLRLAAEGGFLFRTFDAGDPQAGDPQARSDAIRYAGASLEQDLGRFTLRLAGGARASVSNQSAFTYSRLTATLGVSYTLGIF
jgi:tetratricopeptide (TPR) repeat protein